MIKALCVLMLLASLAGCAGYPVSLIQFSDCSGNREATYNCQVERYNKAF